ncbi:MAG: hypothetical protein ACRCWO_08650 [Bosea sp. (in: a-proteobacteria)]
MLFGWSGKVGAERFVRLRAPKTLFGVRTPTVLVWFMRGLALVWLMKGLLGWALIIGLAGEPGAFEKASLAQQTALVFFAVLDLIVGTGLWMATGWGGGVWLIAIAAHAGLALLIPRAITLGLAGAITYGVLAICFVFFAWAAAHHDDQ